MTAVIVLLAVLVVLAGLILETLLLALYVLNKRKDTKATAAQAENTGADERRPGSIDEGFENIMAFSVQGKTGFEQDE